MSTQDIFTRCRESLENGYETTMRGFGAEAPAPLSRYMGGRNRLNHPYVTGYWQFMVDVPTLIFDKGKEKSERWLHSTAEGFTPPTRTLNKADVPGQGGLGSSFVTGQTLTRTFTVTFREYQDLPIFGIAEAWTSVIDPYIGISPVSGIQWIPASYKGIAMAVLTKPTMGKDGKISATDIEQVFFFHGVWPETPPIDTLAQDISANDVLQHTLTFSFDGWPLTKANKGVTAQALEMLNAGNYYEQTYSQYIADIKAETNVDDTKRDVENM
jgi:hypothetical protein